MWFWVENLTDMGQNKMFGELDINFEINCLISKLEKSSKSIAESQH